MDFPLTNFPITNTKELKGFVLTAATQLTVLVPRSWL